MTEKKNTDGEIKLDIQTLDGFYKQVKQLALDVQKIELEMKHRDEIEDLEKLIFRLENPPKKWWQFWK